MDNLKNIFLPKPSLDDQVFSLKFTSKNVEREAKHSKADEAKERAAVVRALKEGRPQVAQIHAENAIRHRNQYNRLTGLSAQLDAVASRVKQASQTIGITQSLGKVAKDLENASSRLDLEEMSRLMNKFESEFDTLDVKSTVLDGAMNKTTTLMAPQDEVNALMKESADAANIDLNLQMPEAGSGLNKITAPSADMQHQLEDALAKLRN